MVVLLVDPTTEKGRRPEATTLLLIKRYSAGSAMPVSAWQS